MANLKKLKMKKPQSKKKLKQKPDLDTYQFDTVSTLNYLLISLNCALIPNRYGNKMKKEQ